MRWSATGVAGGRVESSPGARQRAGAALAESEIVGAGWGSALDFGEIGGEAERFVE